MKNEEIYISGKIGQLPAELVLKNFHEAKWQLKKAGYTKIVNPLEIVHDHDGSWESYMREDIQHLFKCASIFMLRNWTQSPGARIEHAIAVETGKNIIYQEHFGFMEFKN